MRDGDGDGYYTKTCQHEGNIRKIYKVEHNIFLPNICSHHYLIKTEIHNHINMIQILCIKENPHFPK